MAETAELVPEPLRARHRVLAIGGGRGGVGKTLLTANIGIYLAQVGKKALLVDLDTAGGNLHTCLGVERPRSAIGEIAALDVAEIADAVVGTPVPGLSLVTAGDGRRGALNLRAEVRQRLVGALRALEVDYV